MKLAQLSPLLFSFSLAGCGGGTATPIDGPSSADAPVDAAVKTVEVTLVDPPADVAAAGLTFAYQDGDGAWQKVPTPVGGKITLTLSNEKYGFAADCVFNDFHAVETRYATVTDTPAFSQTLEGCTTAPTLAGMMTGQIITLGDSKHALAHGSSQAKLTTVAMQTLPYSFAVAPGTADVLLARSTAANQVDRFGVERAVTVSATTPLTRTFDFNNNVPEPDLVPQPIAEGLDGFFYTTYRTTTSALQLVSSTPPFEIAVPPRADRRSDDTVEVGLTEYTPDGASSVAARKVMDAPQAITVPPNIFSPITAVPTGATGFKLGWQKLSDSTARYGSSITFACGANCEGAMSVQFSSAWLGNGSTAQWTTPAFATALGIPSVQTGSAQVDVTATIETGTYPKLGYTSVAYTNSILFGNARRQPLQR